MGNRNRLDISNLGLLLHVKALGLVHSMQDAVTVLGSIIQMPPRKLVRAFANASHDYICFIANCLLLAQPTLTL
eukprot:4919740-Amphidinium_carterae.1